MKFQDLPSVLPIHMVDSTILLPRAQLPLFLQEGEGGEAIDVALREGHRLIGLVQTNPEGGYFQTGCAGKIISFQEGLALFILLGGICRFDIIKMIEKGPVKKAKVDYKNYEMDLEDGLFDPFVDRSRLLGVLKSYLDNQEIAANWEEISRASSDLLISSLSMAFPFKPLEKQALLESASLSDRCDIMLALMEMSVPSLKGERPVLH